MVAPVMQKCIAMVQVGKTVRETHTSGQNNKKSSLWDPGTVGGIQGKEEPEKVSRNFVRESAQLPAHT